MLSLPQRWIQMPKTILIIFEIKLESSLAVLSRFTKICFNKLVQFICIARSFHGQLNAINLDLLKLICFYQIMFVDCMKKIVDFMFNDIN